MTKLEQKLQELGYERRKVFYHNNKIYRTKYIKPINNVAYIEMNIYEKYIAEVKSEYSITDQSIIDKIQEALDVMVKDLEILKECEE